MSSETEHFSYKGGCGMIHIKAFKRRASLATYKRLHVISNIMLFKTVMPVRN